MLYRIEKGIPAPSRCSYPWEEMQSGDSFFVPNPSPGKARSIATAGCAFCRRNRPDHRVSVHAVEGGTRYWMLKR